MKLLFQRNNVAGCPSLFKHEAGVSAAAQKSGEKPPDAPQKAAGTNASSKKMQSLLNPKP